MNRIHSGLTILAVVNTGMLSELKSYLGNMNRDQKDFCRELDQCTSLLFASISLVPEQRYVNETLPPTLVFATTFCGKRSDHLKELVRIWRTHLIECFRCCQGFEVNHLVKDEDLIDLMNRQSRPHAFNSRYNCITKLELQTDNRLVGELEDYIDIMQQQEGFSKLSAKEIRKLIQKQAQNLWFKYTDLPKKYCLDIYEFWMVHRTAALQWLLFIAFYCFLLFYNGCVSCVLTILLASLVAIGLILLVMAKIITREREITATRPETARIRALAQTQLSPVINEMIAAGPLRPGWLRKHFYYYSLAIVGFLREPFLSVPTVSSIRWVSINERRRLLFLSSYHNTTDFYVREFLTGSTPMGVNFIFSNGQGFPNAPYLYRQGIRADPEGYMDVIHTYQHITDFWYAHDPELSADVINKNRKIRLGLFRPMNEIKSQQWLDLF